MDTEGKYIVRSETKTGLAKRLAEIRKREQEIVAKAKAATRRGK